MGLAEGILHMTVRIETQRLDGATSTGTGFYFNFCVQDDVCIPVIVTNKHVIENANSMTVFLSVLNDDGAIAERKERLEVNGMLGHWVMHPDPTSTFACCRLPK